MTNSCLQGFVGPHPPYRRTEMSTNTIDQSQRFETMSNDPTQVSIDIGEDEGKGKGPL